MPKEKAPQREQVTIETTSLRISSRLNSNVKDKADELGISINAMYSVLIDLGLKTYDSEITRQIPE